MICSVCFEIRCECGTAMVRSEIAAIAAFLRCKAQDIGTTLTAQEALLAVADSIERGTHRTRFTADDCEVTETGERVTIEQDEYL